ncbi:MAG TPA: MBL fold metallo-hydrolase [Caulobacteraceae bacterium]|nr:MBL fold metallo-hydrolase [Caulobacteraceae bacterium]
MRLEFTILGCGSSGGVPRADGNWGACDPNEPKNRRMRCSLMVRRLKGAAPDEATGVLVDTSPDLVRQTSGAGLKRLDGVLLTHDHADQVHGIDDIRAFAIRQRAVVPVWMDHATETTVRRRFGYIFEGSGGYPAIAMPRRLPPHGDAWRIEGPSGEIPIVTFEQGHGEIRSIGYRFGDVAYSSDVDALSEEAFSALQGLDVWIVDALRETPHPSHAHLARTLEWIDRVKPRRAVLTNLHVDLDYATLRAKLPSGVEPAYDGLRFEIDG